MATIVLTGATGLLGSEVLTQLCASGDNEIVCLGRSKPHLQAPGIRFIKADLSKQIPLEQLPHSVDVILHLAQSEKFREFPESAQDVYAVNVAAPFQLLNWAAKNGTGSFVHASTGGVYAPSDQDIVEQAELERPERSGFYASTKHSAELLAAAYSKFFPVVALRYFFIYGLNQRKAMLIPRLVENVRSGRPIVLQGEEGLRFNPVHVSDAARATIAAMSLKESVMCNVAGPEVISMRRAGECIGALLNKEPEFEINRDAPANHMVASIHNMSRLLGEPRVRVAAGIADLCR